MARFSHGAIHRHRREAVTDLINGFDLAMIESSAATRTERRFTSSRIDGVSSIADIVPTEVLALALGVTESEVGWIVEDTRHIAAAIGQQLPPSPGSDRAVNRLRRLFSHHSAGFVAVVSLLYQNYNATSSLIAEHLLAEGAGRVRRSAISSTVRIASRATRVNDTEIAADATVVIDLESAGLEFGYGPHECPGRRLAESIASGVLRPLADSDYELILDLVNFDEEERPRTLPLEIAS
jgi:cytochrome P450